MTVSSSTQTDVIDVLIDDGTSLSAAVNVGNGVLSAIQVPSGWTSANLTFQASVDGSTYANVYTAAGDEYVVTAAASRFIQIPPSAWAGAVRYLKIRSGTSGTPVNQSGAKTLKIVTRAID